VFGASPLEVIQPELGSPKASTKTTEPLRGESVVAEVMGPAGEVEPGVRLGAGLEVRLGAGLRREPSVAGADAELEARPSLPPEGLSADPPSPGPPCMTMLAAGAITAAARRKVPATTSPRLRDDRAAGAWSAMLGSGKAYAGRPCEAKADRPGSTA
jgi:hypothetical protein